MPDSAQPGPSSRPPLALVIEQEGLLRKMLIVALENGGFRVLGMENGDELLTTPHVTLMESSFALVGHAFANRLTGSQTVGLLHLINPRIQIFPMANPPTTDYDRALLSPHYARILFHPFGFAELFAALQKAGAVCNL